MRYVSRRTPRSGVTYTVRDGFLLAWLDGKLLFHFRPGLWSVDDLTLLAEKC